MPIYVICLFVTYLHVHDHCDNFVVNKIQQACAKLSKVLTSVCLPITLLLLYIYCPAITGWITTSTYRQYQYQMCKVLFHKNVLPVSKNLVCLFVSYLYVHQLLVPSTIATYLSAVSVVHKCNKMENPCAKLVVKNCLIHVKTIIIKQPALAEVLDCIIYTQFYHSVFHLL